MSRIELPRGPGSYRWYYVDATRGDFTAVAIFMIGSLFSPRYAVAHRRGAEPSQHAAVNFALYERGRRRAWVLSEYPEVEAGPRQLRIGASTLRYLPGGRLEIDLFERTAPWGRPVHAHLELEPRCRALEPVRLVDGLSHCWHPIAPRSVATVRMPSLGLELVSAHAYHDGNFGDVPLGTDLRGWDWARTHDGEHTTITYRPWSAGPAVTVRASERAAVVTREVHPRVARSTTAWGLGVPGSLGLPGAPALLESSPFYARLEAKSGPAHALGEVADFRRFHSPWIRWMARLRTRMERAA